MISSSSSPAGSAIYAIFTRLRAVLNLQMTDEQLVNLANNQNQTASIAKQKIIALLFQENGNNAIQNLLEIRKSEKREEVRKNFSPHERKRSDSSFENSFSAAVCKELKMKDGELESLFKNKTIFFRVLLILLDLVQRRNTRTNTKSASSKINLTEMKIAKFKSEEPQSGLGCVTMNKNGSEYMASNKISLLENQSLLMNKVQNLESENERLLKKLNDLQELFDSAISETKVQTSIKEKGLSDAALALDSRKSILQQCQILQLKRYLTSFTDEFDKIEMVIAASNSEIPQIKSQLKDFVKSKCDEKTAKDVELIIKRLDSLHKNINRNLRDGTITKEERSTPALEFISEFINPARSRDLKPINLADVMDGVFS